MTKINKINILIMIAVIMLVGTFASEIFAIDSYDTAYIKITKLNQEPDPATPGKYVELRFTVVKMGNDLLNDITFRIEPKYPFSIDSGDSNIKVIDAWKGSSDIDEYYTLYYKLKVDEDAIEDSYSLNLFYSTKEGSWTKFETDIRVDDSNKPNLELGLIRSEPNKVLSDTQDNVLNIEIINTGDGNAENVIAELKFPNGFENAFGYSNRVNIGNIPAHSSKIAKVYFNVNDIMHGSYNSRLNLLYKEENEDEMLSLELPTTIEILSKPKFSIESIKFDKENIFSGDSVAMNIVVKNLIDKDVESISVRAFKESTQPIEFQEKSDYIGTLNSNESGEAVIKFDVKKDAEAKKYILDLEIRSIYNEEVYVQNEKVIVPINSKENKVDQNFITFFLIGIIIVLIIVIIFMKRKK